MSLCFILTYERFFCYNNKIIIFAVSNLKSIVMNSVTQERIIPSIQKYFSTQPINKAWLFGSYSRGEEKEGSDIDILVSFDKDAKISLFKYADIICQLETLLNQKVDLVEEGALLPFAQESANKDKILIYERGC